MEVKQADFLVSSSKIKECPKLNAPEYAFIGRSNVGKSSLINMLTNRKKLAKISGKPGKTQLINHFKINNEWYLVDLPGYGYAKVSKTERKKFKRMIYDYLEFRANLMCVFVLLDSRIPPQEIDLDFMEWLGIKQIPFVMCFTKIDGLKKEELEENLNIYKKTMLERWEELPPIICTSARTSDGQDDILNFIEDTNKVFR